MKAQVWVNFFFFSLLKNHPPKFVPEEDRVVAHVLKALDPYSTEQGGVLSIKHIHFKEKRGNLIVEYKPAGATKSVAFVGSHLDVVVSIFF
jgi:acetylornithine deacetylase